MATEAAKQTERSVQRAYAEMAMIQEDVRDGEFDGARSHIAILRRRLAELDEKLLAAVAEELTQ